MKRLSYHYLVTFIALVAVSFIFFQKPNLDLQVSAAFYHQGGFFQQNSLRLARIVLNILIGLLCLGSLGIFLCGIFKKKSQWMRSGLFILLCFALGPGLIVNTILKDHWGRARPHQLSQFGGTATFQKPWVIGNQCEKNCSFVAGDSSAALVFVALAFLPVSRRWKIGFASFGIVNYLVFGTIRIAQGGHFLSDVLIGGLLVYLIILFLYPLCFFRNVSAC